MYSVKHEWMVSLGRVTMVAVWIGLLFLIASNIQAGWLYVIIAFFGMFLVISIVHPIVSLLGLRAELHLPEFCEKGGPGPFRLTIINPSRYARYLVRATLEPGSPRTDPPAFLATHIPGRGRVSFGGDIFPERREILEVRRVRVATATPIGLFAASRLIPVRSTCYVHPAIHAVREGGALERDIHSALEAAKNRPHSEDPYHYQLRDYTPGDSLRLIHWKQTARLGEPIVRISERRPHSEQTLFVDDVAENYPPGDTKTFEELLDRVASTANHLVFSRSCRVTLMGMLTPPVIVDLPTDWHNALRWLTTIRLASPAGPVQSIRGAHILFSSRQHPIGVEPPR